MKEHIKNHKKQYIFALIILVLVIIVVLAIILTSTSSSSIKGNLELSLEDNTIISGDVTYIHVSAKNAGKEKLDAEFYVFADDPNTVKISYPEPSLLKFSLLPGEGIERRLEVTATSKAIRTDYELTAQILDMNKTIVTSKNVVLTVKRGTKEPEKVINSTNESILK